MKKVCGHIALMVLLIGSVVFAACSRSTIAVGELSFSFDKSAACLVDEEQAKYVKIDLEVENKAKDEQVVLASDFSLSGEELGVQEVFFGNNVVDKSDSETLEAGGKLKLTLTFIVSQPQKGAQELRYKDAKLMDFNL